MSETPALGTARTSPSDAAARAHGPGAGRSRRRPPVRRLRSLRLLAFLAAAQGLAGGAPARADTIFTASARTRDFNGQGLIPRFTYREAGHTYDGAQQERDPLDRRLRTYVATLRGVFGLHEDVTLSLTIPAVVKQLRSRDATGRRIRLESAGLGDTTATAKWRFFRDTELGGTTEAAALLGLELPTGRDDLRDGGARLPPPLQPGSGSVDGLLGLAFTRVGDGGRWLLNADLIYRVNSEANDYRFGNVLRFDLGGQLRVYPWRYERYDQITLNLICELNGRYAEKDTASGDRLRNTGGLTLLAAPGVQLIAGESFLLEAGVQVPILRHLQGPQLGLDVAATVGSRWLF